MMRKIFRKPSNVFEPLMVAVILIGLVRAVLFFIDRSYLPQPFFYDTQDTWMDWFNTAYWAYNPGAYDGWGTIYPPLSFVFLKLFSLSSCYRYGSDPYAVRGCDWLGLATLHFFYFLNFVLLWKSFRKTDKKTALWRTLALGLGLPLVSGLERGNLIIVTMTFFILGFGPLLKSARLRWLAVGIAVNFKVYLITGVFARLLRRQWLWFEGAIIATIAVYLLSYLALGEGTPAEVYANITKMGDGGAGMQLTDVWNSITYNGFIGLLESQYLLLAGHLGSRNVDILSVAMPIIVRTTQAAAAFAAIAAWLRPEKIPIYRLTFHALSFAMATSETALYSASTLIFLLMLERREGVLKNISFVSAYILLVPMDIHLVEIPEVAMDSYIAGHTTFVSNAVAVGHFLRPLLASIMTTSLAILTVYQVWGDIRLQGWQQRWRFRHDAPLLPGILRPSAPEKLAKP